MLFGQPDDTTVIGLTTEEIQRLKDGYPVLLYEGDVALVVVIKEDKQAKKNK